MIHALADAIQNKAPHARLHNLAQLLFPATIMPAVEWLGSPRVRSVCGFRDYLKVCKAAKDPGRVRDGSLVVRTRALDGMRVSLRYGTSDFSVFIETLVGHFHEPPPGLEPLRIWDLGANLGLTTAHYCVLFPKATITAVEPQPDLAAAARLHTSNWSSRCIIVEAAVWTEDTTLTFSVTPGQEYGGHLRQNNEDGEYSLEVKTLSLNTMLQSNDIVDFVKMDIEGAEKRVLSENTEWAAGVRCIQVECHGRFSVDDCIQALTRLGFRASRDNRHWASVIGLADRIQNAGST